MLVFTEQEFFKYIGQYLWPLFRIGALFMAMPVIGTKIVSPRVRIVLAISLTIMVAPLLPAPGIDMTLSLSLLMVVIQQVIIGLAMGFILQVIFHLFILSGQFIAMKMGLGFASMNDPANGVVVTVVSQYYLILTTLLFLSVNGHLLVIDILVDSFSVLPVSANGLETGSYYEIAALGGWMFNRALIIALPVLTSLLVVNIAFGVMSRAAPQMNVFAVGFPITLVFGLLLMWYSLDSFLPNYSLYLQEGLQFIHHVVGTS